ncbi:hypothetical protein SELMODRAFT_407013 [Selaginella moellendorffii]|uniref:Uncharacterized protein n=1 Tax=Selaginella moellendorffii TaxID=88036 RepID=D8R3M4_SELML|nr:hypothetical protein SELMODRAFT_407013 [Selaginella moellendorffii]
MTSAGPMDALSWQYDMADLTTWRMTQLRTSAGVIRGTFVAVIKPSSLGGSETSCISKCVGRNIEATGIVSKALFNADAKRVNIPTSGFGWCARSELGRALPDEDFHQAVVLVFANKQDAMAPAVITAILSTTNIVLLGTADSMEQPGLSQETYERLRECCIFKPVFASPRGYRVHQWRRHVLARSSAASSKSAVKDIIAGKNGFHGQPLSDVLQGKIERTSFKTPEHKIFPSVAPATKALLPGIASKIASASPEKMLLSRMLSNAQLPNDVRLTGSKWPSSSEMSTLPIRSSCSGHCVTAAGAFFGPERNWWTERMLWG